MDFLVIYLILAVFTLENTEYLTLINFYRINSKSLINRHSRMSRPNQDDYYPKKIGVQYDPPTIGTTHL